MYSHCVSATKGKLTDYFGVQSPANEFKMGAKPGYQASLIRLD
jgi:hypothetical protein